MLHSRLVLLVAVLVAATFSFGLSASATPTAPRVSPVPASSGSPVGNLAAGSATLIPQQSLADMSISLDAWASGFSRPLFVTSRPGDDRVYVVQQAGVILSLNSDGTGKTPVLDISDVVGSDGNEQGLLGVAFHPDDPSRMIVDYTDNSGNTRVAEYSFPLAASVANPAQVQLLLHVNQPFRNHNGGMLAFGPDKNLYIGLGDGGSAGDPHRNGQNPKTLLGSILRINIDGPTGYTIPADNPFANGVHGAKQVWAYGLRNPWRFSFDGNRLYVGDVGQNKVEELNALYVSKARGANFGWNVMEGDRCYPSGVVCLSAKRGFVSPIFAYTHGPHGRCSITGGYVYRGKAYPELVGTYFFGDFCSGEVFGLRLVRGTVTEKRVLLNTTEFISSFGEGPDGQLYVVDIFGGSVRRLVPTP